MVKKIPEEDDNYLPEEENFQHQRLMNENLRLQGALTGSGLFDQNDQNSIHERLETDKILERVEHFLRGDQITIGEEGSYYLPPTKNVLAVVKENKKSKVKFYIQELVNKKKGTEIINEVLIKIKYTGKEGDSETDILIEDSLRILKQIKKLKLINRGYEYVSVVDDEKKPFNEYGVSELMRIMSMYVNKETILSCYKEDRIMEILGDLGNALTDFLYANYEKMGMDTKFKESKFQLIILNLLHIVESCYRRALGGAEQRHLSIKGIISEGYMGGQGMHPSMKPRFNLLKPKTW